MILTLFQLYRFLSAANAEGRPALLPAVREGGGGKAPGGHRL